MPNPPKQLTQGISGFFNVFGVVRFSDEHGGFWYVGRFRRPPPQQNLTGEFDIVFTSYGVLCWLFDLTRWANIIVHFLKPDGLFYIVESHPAGNIFDDEANGRISVRYSYFNIGPERSESACTYTDGNARLERGVTYEWAHSMSEVVNALIDAGLEVQFIHEFSFAHYKQLPWMVEGADGWWRLPNGDNRIPFLFSLMAVKKRISG